MLGLHQIVHTIAGIPILRGITMAVEPGEIMCLLGPSGCGKTTLLRVIAGLETLNHGDVQLNGKTLAGVPVHLRDFGLMFQDFALFPHMNVGQNIAFGLKMRDMKPIAVQTRVREVLSVVGLTGFEKRDVAQLSGGERQRVALARSLAPKPRLLMLDEPLGSLDAALRQRLVLELREIIKQIGLTALYVTHDQQEAFAIGDRIALMNAGIIEQIGTPEALYQRPQTVFSAQFLGLHNVLPVLKIETNRAFTSAGTFPVTGNPRAVLLHPDGLHLTASNTPNALHGIVRERLFLGDRYRLMVAYQHGTLMLKVPTSGAPALGEMIHIAPTPDSILPLV